MRKTNGAFAGLLLLLCWIPSSYAQMFSYSSEEPRRFRTVGVGYHVMDFQYYGDGQPSESFDYNTPAYSIFLTQSNLSVALAFGRQGAVPANGLRPLRLIDASLFLWGGISLIQSEQIRIFIPIIAHTGYRSVEERSSQGPTIEGFNITTLGLGIGIGFRSSIGERIQLEGKATPVAGLALRNLEGATGTTRLFEGGLQVHLIRLIRRYGVTAGYYIRYQRWNVDASNLLPGTSEDLFDYKGLRHIFRLGVNW